VVEDGVEEALGLAGAGAGGDQGVAGWGVAAGVELLEGLELVQVGLEVGPDGEGAAAGPGRGGEGETEAQVGARKRPSGPRRWSAKALSKSTSSKARVAWM